MLASHMRTGLTRAAAATGARSMAVKAVNPNLKKVVFVDGARTPFCVAGTEFEDLMAHDLLREAIKGLMAKSQITGEEVDYCLMGTVIQEVLTSNIAREASMGAGLPLKTNCHTITQACISSNACTATGMGLIQTDHADVVMCGGVEVMSDLPIRFSRPIRKRLLKLGKAKTTQAKIALFSGLGLGDLAPQAPGVAEFSTVRSNLLPHTFPCALISSLTHPSSSNPKSLFHGHSLFQQRPPSSHLPTSLRRCLLTHAPSQGEIMGYSADRLAHKFGVSRAEQDAYAARSHACAQDATDKGLFKGELVPVMGSKGNFVTVDNGIRPTTVEKLGSLKPAFIKPHGTVTAASSSFLTDGASASLITSEQYAKERGIQ